MANKDTLRKLGVVRSGTVSGTYKNAKERPTELQIDDVYDAERDLVGGDKSKNTEKEPPSSNSKKTNPLAIIGFVLAFLLPLLGLLLSIVGLVQIKKKKEGGKGLAIAGIIVSCVVALVHLIITVAIIVAVVSSNNITLQEYSDPSNGYTVKYPQGWSISPQTVEGAKGVIIKDEYKETGKVYGQVEAGYMPAPPYGYSKDVLQAITDSLKDSSSKTNVVYESRQIKNGSETVTLVVTYDGENGKVKAKHTIILKKDNSIYQVSTQLPEESWDKYQDAFDEIHNTFKYN